MKKLICSAVALMMAATMFVGCGRRNVSNHSGGMITEPTTVVPTIIPEPTMTNPMPTMTEPRVTTEPTHTTTEGNRETEITIPDGTTGARNRNSVR